MGNGGKDRTENKWDVSGTGQSSPPEVCVIFPREAHNEESAAYRHSNDRSVAGDTAQCCSVSGISMYCYFTRAHLIPAGQYHLPQPSTLSISTASHFQLQSACQTTRRHITRL